MKTRRLNFESSWNDGFTLYKHCKANLIAFSGRFAKLEVEGNAADVLYLDFRKAFGIFSYFKLAMMQTLAHVLMLTEGL